MDRSKTFDWIPHDLRIAKNYAYDFNEKVFYEKIFYQEYPKNLFLDLFSLIFL